MAVNVVSNSTDVTWSRHDLLNWLNETLECNVSKIEDLCTGAAYVQLIHMLFSHHPTHARLVSLKKVKFQTRVENEYVQNWKVFQTALRDLKVDKVVEVAKIIKGKFQDNFEFLQWFKKFYDANVDEECTIDNYHALEERGGVQLIGPSGPAKQKNLGPKRPAAGKVQTTRPIARTSPKAAPAEKKTVPSRAPVQQVRRGSQQSAGDSAKVDELQTELTELQLTVSGLEKERDFYFGKLRDIEVLCQDDGTELTQKVLAILYATEEGFAPPEDEVEGLDGEQDEY
ncbi:microtubule-associated protein RP/EB family member 1-like isoform X2 [Lineus longissimus]|uniref:microtubule-associated protein RP/EB family member 1-like isoform X2 n=1 Tax=Lineus longissimus TaxID=88925 RepID=UPI002B4C784A